MFIWLNSRNLSRASLSQWCMGRGMYKSDLQRLTCLLIYHNLFGLPVRPHPIKMCYHSSVGLWIAEMLRIQTFHGSGHVPERKNKNPSMNSNRRTGDNTVKRAWFYRGHKAVYLDSRLSNNCRHYHFLVTSYLNRNSIYSKQFVYVFPCSSATICPLAWHVVNWC